MKWLSLLAFFCSIYLSTRAQKDSLHQLFIKNKCGSLHLSISPKRVTSNETIPPYFSGFEVVDFRLDTSRLGFWAIDKDRREYIFHEPASQAVSTFLNHYAQPGGNRSILIIIKKFWVYDTLLMSKKMVGRMQLDGRIEFRGEAFLKTDNGYRPITYMDTIITSPNSAKDMAVFRLPNLFFVFIKKIASINEEAVLKRNTVFSFGELEALNKKRFAYPMDTVHVLRKGVYANVEEFRNNQPSIFNYEIQPDENGLSQLYLKDEDGKLYFSRKMWGYCDGQQCYAMMDGNLFPILSVNHAYYVFGSKVYQRHTKAMPVPVFLLFPPVALLGLEPISESATRKLHFFRLDPYTGNID